ncbi:FAD dependent oxidoreductase-domain-containing protein [Mycena leptocephala]|nr:FAD dependent oxidoreductase-domain-containing protein [Mycena leptocephala]
MMPRLSEAAQSSHPVDILGVSWSLAWHLPPVRQTLDSKCQTRPEPSLGLRHCLAIAHSGYTKPGQAVLTTGAGYWYLNSGPAYPLSTKETRRPPPPWTPPSREHMLKSLKASGAIKTTGLADEEFDLLVVGGGATGAGVAVDAASRGLKVALVERDDFRTSSKSTKLVHGGQYKLVREALHERRIFLQTAPYLSAMLPIMLPIYKYWQIPYYWSGCKMYDILAGKENMESSYLMSKGKALETFPMLKSDGLVGALVYYDGQHNGLPHEHRLDYERGQIWCHRGQLLRGPFSDTLLTLDNPAHQPIVQPSSGIHITLPNYYSPRKMGLLDPATSDGRVIFFLPWQGNTIAGTTDSPAEVEREPRAQEEEIRWVLEEVRRYLAPDIKGLVRNHMIHVSESGLLTIAGGKWTTYRAMAQETVDEAVKVFGLQDRVKSGCVTDTLRLVGSDGWSRNMFIGLIQRYGLETEVARHLSDNYGDRAWTVCSFAEPTGNSWPLHGTRLSPLYPFIEAEVRYAVRHEYALTPIDVLARRTRLSFLNAHAALEALPRVVDIMATELHWSRAEKARQVGRAVAFLSSMGLSPDAVAPPIGLRERAAHALWGRCARAKFDGPEMAALKGAFARNAEAVAGPAGQEVRLAKAALGAVLKEVPGYADIPAKDCEYVLEEAGFKSRVDVDFDEFLEICGSLKEVSFAHVPSKQERLRIPVEKSGGGV